MTGPNRPSSVDPTRSAFATLDETVAEALVDAVEDDDAAAGGASLPGIAECRQRSPAHRLIQIRIVADHEGVLAAEFERDRASRSPATLWISRPTRVEPVKLTTPTSRCATSAAPASPPRP